MLKRFDCPVRCSAGHLFTTIWVPLASVKAVRLGGTRWQYCPVGRHWAMVTRVKPGEGTVTEADLATAALVHDIRVP